MRAATIANGRILIADRPDPSPGRGQVLIGVHAAGLNNADLQQRDGIQYVQGLIGGAVIHHHQVE